MFHAKTQRRKERNKAFSAKNVRIAIVASCYNADLMEKLVGSTQKALVQAGAKNLKVVRVPGAYEIPMVAMKLARQRKYHAIIALGIVLQGKTAHADHIGAACSLNLQRIAIETGVPVIHQILTPRNLSDALARVKIRGEEAARTAFEMVGVMQKL